MKKLEWPNYKDQMCLLGNNRWSISRLLTLSADFPVFEAQIDCLNVYRTYENISVREMVMHAEAIINADTEYPIILDEDGEIMDGVHRIMNAIMNKKTTVKAVRFEENPPPCKKEGD